MIPPSRKAKEKAAEKTPEKINLPRKGRTHFEKVFYGDEVTDNSSQESEISDYNGRRVKRKNRSKAKGRKTKRRKVSMIRQSPTPEAPEMSDKDVEGVNDQDSDLFVAGSKTSATVTRKLSIPSTLHLEIRGGPTSLNIDLARFLNQQEKKELNASGGTSDDSTLIGSNVAPPATDRNPKSLEVTSELGAAKNMRSDPARACFLELEPDLRNRIYRLSLVVPDPVHFSPARGTARTVNLLRACRQIHTEASEILYGENSFHFERVTSKRGTYHDKEWKEVGYKDVRRFLSDIGPHNRSYMRYISLDLSDAHHYQPAYLDFGERRFVNDPVVFQILKLIGSSGAILDEFAVGFTGKQHVNAIDYHFLKAFTSIRCRQLSNTTAFGQSRIQEGLIDKIKDVMELPPSDDFSDKKKKKRMAKMIHEKPTTQDFNHFNW